MTATNQYGSNTNTKTNYIVVSGDFVANWATLDSGTNYSGDYTKTRAAGRRVLGDHPGEGRELLSSPRDLHHEHGDEQPVPGGHHRASQVHGRQPLATQPQKIYLYNNSTSAWDLEDTYNLGTSVTTRTITVSSASNYMSSGTVKVRVYLGGTGANTAYIHWTDWVKINCTP